MEDQEIVNEFLIESTENLARLDQEMVELEQRPDDSLLLASIFRTIHTIKGTCGFFGFHVLEAITHHAENLLSQVRNGERPLSGELVSLVLQTVDATKQELLSIERTGRESGYPHQDLRDRLQRVCEQSGTAAGEQPPVEPQAPAAAPSAESSAPEPESSRGPSVTDTTIRVDIGLLDKLMNLVGELVLARNQIMQYGSRFEDTQFTASAQRLNSITTQLQEGVMKTRMQPIGVVWNKLPRVVRDLAATCGKQIQLEMDGADTELDRTIIEAIKDPLTHIVRNCCDHGIESPDLRTAGGKDATGTLSLRAFHEGGQVIIEIIDDGGGIDPEKVKARAVEKGVLRAEQAERMSEREALHLIFAPGFSTAAQVSNISGRGVGMDVVKTNIERIGGSVDLHSKAGEGTTVKLKIPLTLAIIPGLVVSSGGERFVIPQVSLLELLRLEGDSGCKMIEFIHGAPVYRHRGALLPIAYLSEVLGLPPRQSGADTINIVVLQVEDRQFGLVIDAISGTQEIVVKPLGKQLKGLTCYAGATIMGDGRVALILDVAGIGLRSGVLADPRTSAAARDTEEDHAGVAKQTVLLFRTGSFERLAVPLSLVARLEEFPRSRIELASGRKVIQYRGHILPLVDFGNSGEETCHANPERGETDPDSLVQAIVFADGERRVGLLVDRILDIVEDELSIRTQARQPGLLGSAVVEGKVTDFIDLPGILAQGGDTAFGGNSRSRLRVVVFDPSAFTRGAVRGYLEMAGHDVLEAGSEADAVTMAGTHRPDAVLIASSVLGNGQSARFLDRIRQTAIPVIALTDPHAGVQAAGFDPHGTGDIAGWLSTFDRVGMLASLDRLANAVGPRATAERERIIS